MVIQRVVRTYPSTNTRTTTTESLSELLKNGLKVVMCNPFSVGNMTCLEYIVQKGYIKETNNNDIEKERKQ